MNALKSLFVVVVGLLHDRCCVQRCAFGKEPLIPNFRRLSLTWLQQIVKRKFTGGQDEVIEVGVKEIFVKCSRQAD